MGRFREILRLLWLPCEGFSVLISRSLDEPLPLPERLALRLHLLYCMVCRRFKRQVLLIRDASRRLITPIADRDSSAPTLPVEVRERIKRSLDGEA